jgi:hypothetical protein
MSFNHGGIARMAIMTMPFLWLMVNNTKPYGLVVMANHICGLRL